MTDRRPHVLGVRLHAKGKPYEPMTMAKHTVKGIPRSAVKLSDTVWYMPKTAGGLHGNNAQVFTTYLGWAYWLPASRWDANGCIEPRIEVLA